VIPTSTGLFAISSGFADDTEVGLEGGVAGDAEVGEQGGIATDAEVGVRPEEVNN